MTPEDLRASWSDLMPPGGLAVTTDRIDVDTSQGPLLLGKDDFGAPHLLIPSGSSRVPVDRASKGVILVEQELTVDGAAKTFADLVCTDAALESVFAQLCADVTGRIAQDPKQPVGAVIAALGEWRELLRTAPKPAASGQVGLRGELEILSRLAEIDPSAAISVWTGPTGAIHDFEATELHLEVKTSTARDGLAVEMHGLDQLDPAPGTSLWVAFVRLAADEHLGVSVAEQVDLLLGSGVPVDQLMARLANVGYDHKSGADWSQKWVTTELALWPIGEDFPGLRRSDQRQGALRGVERVTYQIDLAAAGNPASPEMRLAVFDQLVGGG